jgi:thioredoxin-related protein
LLALLYRLATVLLLATSVTAGAAGPSSDSTTDWSRTGASAREAGLPVVVLVTGSECGHCERMRGEFLADPRMSSPLAEQAVCAELYRDSAGKIVDFDGERIRSRVFLSRYDVFATPTLLFLDPAGLPLAAPIVGFNDAETYRELVSERLTEARSELQARADQPAAALTAAAQVIAR